MHNVISKQDGASRSFSIHNNLGSLFCVFDGTSTIAAKMKMIMTTTTAIQNLLSCLEEPWKVYRRNMSLNV